MTDRHAPSRRRFLRHSLGLAAVGAAPKLALASAPGAMGLAKELAFNHTHTRERLSLVYALGPQYLSDSLGQLNHFLRDHYSGTVGQMDPLLFDQLHHVRTLLGARMPFEVISGYRCPETNDRLRNTRGGGVAKRSMHMEGRAIDVRLPGVPLAELRDAALSLQAGGVGYYPAEQFVHLDTGRVRHWG